jgi:hypothetical protein
MIMAEEMETFSFLWERKSSLSIFYILENGQFWPLFFSNSEVMNTNGNQQSVFENILKK